MSTEHSPDWDYEDYKRDVLAENSADREKENPVRQRCRIISFTSHSSGRGRKRRSREVSLLVVDGTYAHIIKNREIKPRRSHNHIQIDILANEILNHLPPDERTVDNLLKLVSS